MLKKNLYTEPDNDWANDIKDNPIHISQATSGAKGYYCMGCTKEMQAVKRKNTTYQSYFRHHIKDVDKSKIECVHASKEYRERLAYFYFQRVKQIKVPAIYKFPPKGENGNPKLLEDTKTVVAHRVARELTFYENENGEIKWGKNPEIDERYLLVRPDAVFFDADDKPILFLEFVVTHKPDIDKLNKLKRLGINTVQIIVPKLPEEELEKSISSVSKVKWTYNEIESNTEYIPVSSGDTEGILFIDEEQRKLFEESFKCRSAQIGNLIRSIKRCLESQSYRGAEHNFEREISRIEKATKEHQSKLDGIQEGIESEIKSELREKIQSIEHRRAKFESESSDLEERYNSKRSKITREQNNIEREIELRHEIGGSENSIRNSFGGTEEQLGTEFERARSTNGRSIEREIATISEYRRYEKRLQREIDEYTTFEREFGRIEQELKQQFELFESQELRSFEIEQGRLYSKIKNFGQVRKELEDRIRDEYERRYQQIAKRIDSKNVFGGDELSLRIEKVLQVRGHLDGYQRNIERIKLAKQIVEDETYRKWY